jgi:hypothetical protein
MTTTQIFAELLIIGIGVAIWLTFLVASIFKYHFDCSLLDMNATFLTAIAGVAYVLGIIVDRISYGLFHFIDKYNKKKSLGSHLNQQ